jgi:hypothetical protein
MFRNALQHLQKPLQGSVVSVSFKKHAPQWTLLTVLSFAALIIGLDNTILNGALLSFPGQLGAEGSSLQWIARAKAIAVWSGTASEGLGLGPLAGGGLLIAAWSGRRSLVKRHGTS